MDHGSTHWRSTTHVDLDRVTVTSRDDVLDAPLTTVSVNAESLGADGIAALPRLEALERLILDGCALQGRDLEPLARLPALTALAIEQCPGLDNASLAYLRGLTRLERLKLELDEDLSDEAVMHVARLTSLRELDLRDGVLCGDAITDEGARELDALWRLESLLLWGAGLRDDALAAISSLASLRRLELWDARGVGSRGLAALASCRALERLALRRASLDGDGLAPLRYLPRLHALDLGNVAIGERGAEQLARVPGLLDLSLDDAQLDDRGVAHLSALQRLERLRLANNPALHDAALHDLSELRTLVSLDLEGCPRVGDDGVAALARLERLERLDLSGTSITDGCADTLARLPRLQRLWLSGTAFTNAGLDHLRSLPELRQLYVMGCAGVTEEGARALFESRARQIAILR